MIEDLKENSVHQPLKKIKKEWVHLSPKENQDLVAAGFDTSSVLKELVQSGLHAFPRVSVQNCLQVFGAGTQIPWFIYHGGIVLMANGHKIDPIKP